MSVYFDIAEGRIAIRIPSGGGVQNIWHMAQRC